MRKHVAAHLAVLLSFILLSACVPLGPSRPPSNPGAGGGAERTLVEAEMAYGNGRYQEAVAGYKAYLNGSPNPARVESALAAYGLAAEKAGLYKDALTAFSRLSNEFPQGRFGAEAAYRLPELYFLNGDVKKAGTEAEQLLSRESDRGRQNHLRLLVAQSQWVNGYYSQAATNFLNIWHKAEGNVKAEAEKGLLGSLARLETAELETLKEQYGQNFPGPEATYFLIYQAAKAGDKERVAHEKAYFEQYFPNHPLYQQVVAFNQVMSGPGGFQPPMAVGGDYTPKPVQTAQKKELIIPGGSNGLEPPAANMSGLKGRAVVAVILPLSGDSSSNYAQEALAGIKLALSIPGGEKIELMVLDSRGSGPEAARLVKEAANDPKVLAVIGPFLSREAAPAASAAQSAGLPLIGITQKIDIINAGPFIFRVFLTPKHQAEAVARYAVRAKNHTNLAILYPNDGYGRPMKQFFEAEVNRLGATLTAADSYDPKAKNWGDAVKRLTGGRSARNASSNYQASTSFTVLYLPDSAAAAAQILPLMAFNDVTQVQYLGSNLWLNKELLAGAGRYAQGAAIPTAISDLSRRSETKRFIAAFQQANGRAPDQFAAYGHDAALALLSAFKSGAGTRDEVRRALAGAQNLPGVTGPFGFDAQGDYAVEPILLTVDDRSFKLLRDAEPLK